MFPEGACLLSYYVDAALRIMDTSEVSLVEGSSGRYRERLVPTLPLALLLHPSPLLKPSLGVRMNVREAVGRSAQDPGMMRISPGVCRLPWEGEGEREREGVGVR
jgi:hypothetical protein